MINNKKILIVMGGYFPETTPNGVCIKAVTAELLKDGYEVHILNQCEGKETEVEGVYVHYIPNNLFLKMQKFGEQHPMGVGKLCYKSAMLLNKFQKLLMLPWYPLNHPLTLHNFYSKTVKLQKKYGFERIIGVYHPLEATLASLKFKNKNPEIPVAVYVSDSLIYMSGSQYFPPKVAEKLKWRLEKKVYEGADRVFNIRCHEVHHQDKKYDPYRSKMVFLDTPLFEPSELPTEYEPMFDKSKIQWVYMGTMFENYREPYYMARLVEALETEMEIQVQFFTRGSCESWLADKCKECPKHYMQHGYVSNSLTPTIYANSDFLINLGVNITTMISSKIFLYMSYGKPIIHFYYQDDDVCNTYLQKYPGCCLIQMKDELFEENKKKLATFIKENRGRKYDSAAILDLFRENTPRNTADAFEADWAIE